MLHPSPFIAKYNPHLQKQNKLLPQWDPTMLMFVWEMTPILEEQNNNKPFLAFKQEWKGGEGGTPF